MLLCLMCKWRAGFACDVMYVCRTDAVVVEGFDGEANVCI